MQNIFKSTILKIKNNAEEEYTEFKKTKWLLEFIKIFITALVTTTVLFVIRSNSKGELEGVELKEYLTYLTCDAIGITRNLENIDFNTPFDCLSESVLSDQKTLISCGSYRSSQEIKGTNYNGRFFALFERKDETFINSFLGTIPKYEIKYIRVYEAETLYDNIFYFTDYISEDIDENGTTELILFFRTNYADRTGETAVMLTKENNTWSMVKFPFEEIFTYMDDNYYYTSDVTESTYYLSIEKNHLYDPNSSDEEHSSIVYFLSRGSDIKLIRSPIEKNICFLINIAAQGNMEEVAFPSQDVYICLNYEGNNISVNKHWNGGIPLVVKDEEDFNPYDYFGTKIGNLVFY